PTHPCPSPLIPTKGTDQEITLVPAQDVTLTTSGPRNGPSRQALRGKRWTRIGQAGPGGVASRASLTGCPLRPREGGFESGDVRTCRVRCWQQVCPKERLGDPGERARMRPRWASDGRPARPRSRGPASSVPSGQGRKDTHAGAAPRRGQRGRYVPRPGHRG